MGLSQKALVLAIGLFLIVQFVGVLSAPRKKNYYELLGVEKDAEMKVIKRSYFKLALKYHPDKNPDVKDRALLEKHFSELSHAYEVLSREKTRQRYDELLKQGLKDYGGEEIERDEKREASGERSSYEVFEEAERLSEEEMRQQFKEKAVLVTMLLGMLGIGGWYVLKSRKWRRTVGIPVASSNINTSSELQAALGLDRERQLSEIEKARLKEEVERAKLEKISEIVERRRIALAELAIAREEAEQAEKENQRALARAQREERQNMTGSSANHHLPDLEGQTLETFEGQTFKDQTFQDQTFQTSFDSHSLLDPSSPDPFTPLPSKTPKTADHHCKPCKKSFKSPEQLENHFASKKHKQTLKDLEREAKKAGSHKAD